VDDVTEVIDHEDLLAQAETEVRRLTALGADGAEVYVASGSGVEVEVERDVVSYTTSDLDAGFGLRVVRDGRLGFAYTSVADRIESAGRLALDLSRLSPRLGYVLPAASPSTGYTTVPGIFDSALVTMEPGEVVEMAGDMVDAVKEVHEGATVAGAGVSVGIGAVAIANSEGVSISSRGTSMAASAYVVLRDASVSTGFDVLVSRVRDIDAGKVGASAARMAVDAQGAEPLEEGGEMTVVFRPSAFTELAEHTLVPSVIGDAAQRGESAFSGRDGQVVATPELRVVDDPHVPGGSNSGRSDDEGVPSRPNVLIERGVLEGFLYDTFTAHEYGLQTTGSAIRGAGGGSWKGMPEAFPSNLVIDLPSKGELEDLVAEVDRGIIIHDMMGAHTSNRSTLDFSVNSTMPFEVRNGEVLGVREPVMLGGNFGKVLEGIVGAGGRPRQCPGSMSPANLILPWIAAEGVTVTV
jgi:PmbA protein